MAFSRKKTPEELAEEDAARAEAQARYEAFVERAKAIREAEGRPVAAPRPDERQVAFFRSPAGSARAAYDQADYVFQCSIEGIGEGAGATVVVGSTRWTIGVEPTAVLNAISRQGWDLVSGSFVDSTAGGRKRVVGHYLFRNYGGNRWSGNPWEHGEVTA